MECCGGGGTAKKVGQIATGYINLARGVKYEFTDDRVRACQKCEDSTWLTKSQFGKWLVKNNVKVLRNWKDLSVLPKLPKEENGRGRGLYCRICKCYVPAKARVDWVAELAKLNELLEAGDITQDAYDKQTTEIESAKCPKNLWPSEEDMLLWFNFGLPNKTGRTT